MKNIKMSMLVVLIAQLLLTSFAFAAATTDPYLLQAVNPVEETDPETGEIRTQYYFDDGSPSWANPDIKIFPSTNPRQNITGTELIKGQKYRVQSTVYSNGLGVKDVNVVFGVAEYGSGVAFREIGRKVVKLRANGKVNTSIDWTCDVSGHFCIQVTLECSADSNTANNWAQHNFESQEIAWGTAIPFKFLVGNLLNNDGTRVTADQVGAKVRVVCRRKWWLKKYNGAPPTEDLRKKLNDGTLIEYTPITFNLPAQGSPQLISGSVTFTQAMQEYMDPGSYVDILLQPVTSQKVKLQGITIRFKIGGTKDKLPRNPNRTPSTTSGGGM
ncbi:MAG: hypothetical protein HQM10_12460 [Candidatus Riflebacteria bacterium]|nr:hypothetical protein [Candidatus Riflebacteria bacterium]